MSICFIIFGIFFAYMGLRICCNKINFLKKAVTIQGTVVGFLKKLSDSGTYLDPHYLYCPVVKYMHNGIKHTAEYYDYVKGHKLKFNIGDTILILVDPSIPKKFMLISDNKYLEPSGLFIMFSGMVFIISGIILLVVS